MLGSIFVTNTDVIILMWFAAAALAIKEFILKW